MMIVANRETQSSFRTRTALRSLSLWIVVTIAVCALQSNSASASVELPTARECAEWANQAFFSPSPARSEAFVNCIVERDAAIAGNDLGYILGTGGDGLGNDLLATDDDLLDSSDDECAYLRIAVQSPAGSDEVYQKPMRDLFAAALTRSGFEVVTADASHHWWASILAMDTGPDSAVWTILVRAVPEIGDGLIQFTTVRRDVNGREGAFSGLQSLRAFSKTEAPEAAMLAAAGIATELLPAAHQRCADSDGTEGMLTEAGIRLEQLQKELVEEIQRVRRETAERKKDGRQKELEIEVEG